MTDAPLRIWAVHHETQGAVMIGEWADTIRHIGGNEYHLHTREALSQSPIVQAMIKEAVERENNRMKHAVRASAVIGRIVGFIGDDPELAEAFRDMCGPDLLEKWAAAIRLRG